MLPASNRPKIRLYVEHPLGEDQTVPVDRDQANYLFNVMRLGPGAEVALFNGRDGEWRAEVAEAGKRRGLLISKEKTAELQHPPDLWLLFAPIKKARTDFIVEKAVELGAARICPVQTAFTNAERIRRDRLQAHAVEAAEQCGATFVPDVAELQKLSAVLEAWDPARRLGFADERLSRAGAAQPPTVAKSETPGPWALLIGPEGGFSEAEHARLHALPYLRPMSLGPRVLRADTAAVAAITLWQIVHGEWSIASF